MIWQSIITFVCIVLIPIWLWQRHTRVSFSLNEKVIIITGAASGIGKSLAEIIYQKNYNVVLVLLDINIEGLQLVASKLQKNPDTKSSNNLILSHQCDVANPEQVKACIESIRKEVSPKPISLLVNNAGIVKGRHLLELSAHDIRHTFEVNTMAHFWTIQNVLPSMKEATEAKIVTVSSLTAFLPLAGLADYSASKAAASALNNCLRLELWKMNLRHISTLLVCPGPVDTGMFEGIWLGLNWLDKITQWITPLIKEKQVAELIYSAIATDQLTLMSCYKGWRHWLVSFALCILAIVPTTIGDIMSALGGGLHGMDTFQGRQNTGNSHVIT